MRKDRRGLNPASKPSGDGCVECLASPTTVKSVSGKKPQGFFTPESTIGYPRFHRGFWIGEPTGERSEQASTTGRPGPNRREKTD